ncbi:MAG: PKD domain-containing protein, partial [bacterium]
MKKEIGFIFPNYFWILTIFFLFGNHFFQANASEIHVPNDYPVIQAAIDAAQNGDSIVTAEGRYTGEGNINLNFRGKAISVRSRDLDNPESIRKTIIDAQGKGIIVRFINDEGPESVFAGFTLIGGDASEEVRGIPGYFEFSEKALPTTQSLRIGEYSPPSENQSPFNIAKVRFKDGFQYDNRVWNGRNPFHQPFATSRYYGSGDVDCDGEVDSEDLALAQEIFNGSREPYPTADVNADSKIDHEDIDLINDAINGNRLPSSWDLLNDRAERSFWIDQIISIDQTDKHPYSAGWFSCENFADQLYIHATGCRVDLYRSVYNGGETLYNLPMYIVWIVGFDQPFGHFINAILVGDDPLNFEDWRFIEPQLDYDVHPGMWDMPYGSELTIRSPDITGGTDSENEKVVFYVDESGWSLKRYSPYLVLERSDPPLHNQDNRYDLWNPRIIPEGSGMILYDRLRDDMSRMNDIHLADLPFIDSPSDKPLILSSEFSRLLDVCKGTDGRIHVLWQGKPGYQPGIFYGQLDPNSRSMTNIDTISSFGCWPEICKGRLVISPENQIHAFWFAHWFAHTADPIGIYWTYKTESGWLSKQNLTPDIEITPQLQHFPNLENRDLLRYFFDLAIDQDGRIILAWSEQKSYPVDSELYYRTWNNVAWSAKSLIESGHIRGVKLCNDSYGKVHLFRWIGNRQSSVGEGRGNLEHLMFNGSEWSGLTILDDTGEACCPWAAAGNEGEIYLVWERKINNQVIPVLKRYMDNVWHADHILSVREGTNAWYPLVERLPDGSPMVAWSSRSSDRVTIQTLEASVFANFYSNITSGYAPLDVTFTDYSGFDITSWEWDFGDSNTSTGQNPSYIYQNPGTYSVSLTVTNSSGSVTETKSDYIIVSPTPPPPSIYIQQAINNAQDGDEIILPEGIYIENINFLGKGITLRSSDPNNPDVVASTIIDGGQTGSVVTFNMGEDANCILNGITLRNGRAYKGGGIHCSNASSPTIMNCVITDCESVSMGSEYNGEGGGGIYCNDSSPEIIHSIITQNTASYYGGGIFCDNASPFIEHCTISDNGGHDGAGIVFRESSSNISNCQIMNNSVNDGDGGGIYCYQGSIVIDHCVIRENIIEGISGQGGGIYCEQSTPVIKKSLITENSVNNNGGGICSVASTPEIMNCIINGNSAFSNGGGVIVTNSSPVQITNSTITRNSAWEGGGLYFASSDLTIINSIFWNDLPDEIDKSPFGGIPGMGSTITLNYSNIQGGYE